MKKMFFAVALLAAALTATAQEAKRTDFPRLNQPQTKGFTLPDSLAHMSPWKPGLKTLEPLRSKPAISMTSVVAIQKENMPKNVTVINNNTLRLGSHFNLSNGQAWNFGPFPDAYLDARTLSFPAPR